MARSKRRCAVSLQEVGKWTVPSCCSLSWARVGAPGSPRVAVVAMMAANEVARMLASAREGRCAHKSGNVGAIMIGRSLPRKQPGAGQELLDRARDGPAAIRSVSVNETEAWGKFHSGPLRESAVAV